MRTEPPGIPSRRLASRSQLERGASGSESLALRRAAGMAARLVFQLREIALSLAVPEPSQDDFDGADGPEALLGQVECLLVDHAEPLRAGLLALSGLPAEVRA